MVIDDSRTTLLALDGPSGRFLQQSRHRAAATGCDSEPLFGEPVALKRIAAAEAADNRVVADLDLVEADSRVAVRIGVREGWVIEDLDPVGFGIDVRNDNGVCFGIGLRHGIAF